MTKSCVRCKLKIPDNTPFYMMEAMGFEYRFQTTPPPSSEGQPLLMPLKSTGRIPHCVKCFQKHEGLLWHYLAATDESPGETQ